MKRWVASCVARATRPSRHTWHHPSHWINDGLSATAYHPYPSLFQSLRSLDHFHSPFGPLRAMPPAHHLILNAWSPWSSPKITSTDAATRIALDVPGFKIDDIHVTLESTKRVLSVHGRQTTHDADNDHEVRSFAHRWKLDEDVVWDADKITATLQDGILTVTVPKDVESTQELTRNIPVTAPHDSELTVGSDDSVAVKVE